jgi:ribonuclease PH
VDANVVVLEPDRYVEVQATGEAGHFGRRDLDALLALADRGIARLFTLQREAVT